MNTYRVTDDFLAYVKARIKVKENGCWHWQKAGRSRPFCRLESRTVLVYRVLWERINGPIAEGLMVCHSCDNGMCCNPAHLFLGDAKTNMQDMATKGRHWSRRDPDGYRAALEKGQAILRDNPHLRSRGEDHWTKTVEGKTSRSGESHWTSKSPERIKRGSRVHNARFSEAEIQKIRSDSRTLKAIAADYGCHFSTISLVKRGRHYGSDPAPFR